MRSDMDLPNYSMPAFTPQLQSITTLLAGTHFTVPRREEGRDDLGGWLHTEIKCRLRESNPDTITHPSTNRAQRRLTSLIETNALPLRHAATLACVRFNELNGLNEILTALLPFLVSKACLIFDIICSYV